MCMCVLKYMYNEHPAHYYVLPYSLEPEPFPEPAARLGIRDPSVSVPNSGCDPSDGVRGHEQQCLAFHMGWRGVLIC